MITIAQQWIFLILSLLLFVVEVWALINAARFRGDAYVAAGKRTKTFWVILTALAVLLGFLSLPYPLGGGGTLIFLLAGIIIAGIFLADVLPALRSVMARAHRSRW